MKQTTKRLYGTLAAIAFFSGVTGAFTYSIGSKIANKGTESAQTEYSEAKLLTCSNIESTPVQPVDLTVAAEKGCASVVYIKVVSGGETKTVEYRDPFEDFFGDFFGRGGGGVQRRQVQTPKKEGAGSGVIISSDGYIVTNNHVVGDARKITVKLNDNREFDATIVGTDPATDLALIKIEGKDFPAITVGNSDNLKVGEWVLAVGNPFNLTSTVTAGIVSAKGRGLGANGVESFIQTDAAINKGNSGGALVNARGELVGINAMLYSETGSYSGYGFAIPVSIMKKVVSDIKEYGKVQRALLGIKGSTLIDYIDSKKHEDEKYKADFGTNDGVYVADVVSEGAAAEAGIKSGDVITAVAGKKVVKMSELQEAISKYRPGDKTTVTIIRDKKEKTVNVTFLNEKGNTKVSAATKIDVLGAEFKELTDGQKKALNVSNGIQVTNVKAGKFKEVGVQKGYIIRKCNGRNIKTVADLENAFKEAQTAEEAVLYIWGQTPAGVHMSYAIMVGDE